MSAMLRTTGPELAHHASQAFGPVGRSEHAAVPGDSQDHEFMDGVEVHLGSGAAPQCQGGTLTGKIRATAPIGGLRHALARMAAMRNPHHCGAGLTLE